MRRLQDTSHLARPPALASRGDRARIAGAARALGVAAAIVAALSACSSLDKPPEPPKPVAQDTTPRYGLFSQLRALGSGIWGRARVVDRNDGVELTLSMINLPQGAFRVAFGENANCSSPNGFSAGQPWAPAGRNGHDLVQPLFNASEGSSETSVFVPGVHTSGPDGVDKRSIIIYTGSVAADARPDVPNNRIACGTFQPAQPWQF
jgi:Cu/Zn superoxide dismutase